MSLNLLKAAESYLTPDLIRRLSGLVTETPEKTANAMSMVIPAVLAGIADLGSSAAGAAKLMQMVSGGGFRDKLAAFASDGSGSSLASLLKAGEYALNGLLGSKLGQISEGISHKTRIRQGSTASLMSIAAPLLLGVLGREVHEQEIGISSLPAALMAERTSIANHLPPGLAAAFPSAARSETPSYVDAGAERYLTARPNRAALWIAALLLVAGVIGLFNWLRAPDQIRARLASVVLPGGSVVLAAETSMNYALANYLANSADPEIPKRFIFDNLNFATAATQPMEKSLPTVRDLATILNAYPDTKVRLEGHTDDVGDSAANTELSLQRALSVKALLIQNGVDPARIDTVGLGSENPVDSNTTEEGRRRNRRTELLVVRKS